MRLKTRRKNPKLSLVNPADPFIAVDPKPLWSPPKGMNTVDPSTRMANEFARNIRNLWLDEGVQRSRYGTVELGSAGDSTALQIGKFVQANQIGHILRFTPTAVTRWSGSAWVDLGATATGGVDDLWSWAGFGDSLLFSNGVDAIQTYDAVTGLVTTITDAPSASHLTTFGGRVIASNVHIEGQYHPARIAWSGKNDSEDWDYEGESAGYEDLVSTPGGSIDAQLGVHPISDYIAMVIRTGSVWQMTTTGNPIAPFRFSRVYAELGTKAPFTIIPVSGGLIGLFDDDVYILTQSGVTPIGTKIFNEIIAQTSDLSKAVGGYNPLTKEYLLGTGGTDVFRYSFKDKGWARSEYTRDVSWLAYTKEAYRGLTWGEATGTWGSATGTWDDAAKSASDEYGVMMLADDGMTFVEDPTASDDEVGGVSTDAPFEVASGVIQSGSPLHRLRILEIQMEYEASEAQDLIFEYSYDEGSTWTTYSTASITTTSGPELLSVRNEFTHRQLQIRVRSTTLGQLKLISIFAFTVEDARVHH